MELLLRLGCMIPSLLKMGYVSRKIFPACGRMCICCPALRASSRQPVKRYKKLVTDIFPKSPDGQSSDRKIVKLCEYAAKNPLRIPKITKYLEERLCKELRNGHQKIVNVIVEVYKKLLCTCSNHMAYFASSVLNVTDELLDSSKHAALHVAGCQTLSKFIRSQIDGTYARNIENLVPKVCTLARENGEHQLQASSLQCLEAMVWFMAEFSNIFEGLDEIVHVMLENYEPDMHYEDGETGDQRHHWVDEVVRCKGKGGMSGCDGSPSRIIVRPCPEKKDPSSLTREEDENPKVWAQICLQRMGELARESTTMRRILEPMFVHFDNGYLWAPQQSLTMTVLSDMCYFVDISENQQLILAGLVRHLDHKNVVHDPLVKSYVIRKATYLARQIRSGGTLMDTGCIGDLCRHLRKSLQATSGQVSEHERNLNIQLQNSIEACLLEIVRMKDAGALFDLMAITLEKLPPVAVVARATVGSMIILAHVFASASVSPSQQVFPESLLVPLLKAMLHSDTEARIGAHYIFSVLLFPSSNYTKQHGIPWRASCCHDRQRRQLNTSSTIASVTALLEKLRREKDGVTANKLGSNSMDDIKVTDFSVADQKQGWTQKNSPSVCKITSFIERAAGDTSFSELEPYAMKLNEDQIVQLLSGFWIQANLPDNLPSNYEAIAHSYSWTLVFAQQMNSSANLVTRFFQLPLSLRNISLDPNCGKLPSACKRSLYVTAMAMFMFAAKTYHINDVNDLLSSSTPYDIDPCLGISEDLHLYVKPVADIRQYCSAMDNQTATSMLCELYTKSDELDKVILDLLVTHLSNLSNANQDDVKSQLLETFSLEDAFIFTPQAVYDLEHIHMFGHAKDSSYLDPELSANSIAEEESISSMSNATHLITKPPLSPSMSNIISIGQLLESALEVAGQVAGTSVSTSPLPYSAMASQCEALGTGTRKKLSTWLVHDNHHADARFTDDCLLITASPAHGHDQALTSQMANDTDTFHGGALLEKDSSLTLRLPPASPFDNFLRAVSGPTFSAAEVAM
ncbi:hypothetical protein V2J09_007840 [Rumex salicifolius]